MATATPALTEMQAIRDRMQQIRAVEEVYAQRESGCVNVLIVLPDDNRTAQKAVFAAEGDLIDAFPGTQFDFDVVFRFNRPLREIVSPSGVKLFSR